MDWWENWLASIVGAENVFIVTWLLVVALVLLALVVLLAPRGPR